MATASSRLDGLGQVAVGPAVQAVGAVLGADEDARQVQHRDGRVAGWALMRRQTSKPLMSGRSTSRMIRSGLSAARRRASLPVPASTV